MRIFSLFSLLSLLASAVIIAGIVGCSRSEPKSEKESVPAAEQTPDDETFAKTHGAVWITTKLDPVQSKQFTVDFQDGLFSEGSTLACDVLVSDAYRENGSSF